MMHVVGLGQPAAGDDGVGHVVIGALRARCLPEGVQLLTLTDGTGLVELLDGHPVLVVDGVVGAGPPGQLLQPTLGELGQVGLVSTHGIGLVEAVGLARALEGEGATAGLTVLAVSIEPPGAMGHGLSRAVAEAVAPAVERIEAWVRAQQESRHA